MEYSQMPSQTHRRLQVSFWFLFVAIGLIAVGLAWKFDWLPIAISDAETGQLAEGTGAESNEKGVADPSEQLHFMPSGGSDLFTPETELPAGIRQDPLAQPLATSEEDTSFLRQQSEPDARSKPPFEFYPADRTSSGIDNGNVATADYTIEAESAAGAINSPPRRIVQTGNEKKVPTQPEKVASREKPATVDLSDASSFQTKLTEIDRLIAAGEDIKAHRELSQLYWNHQELRPLFEDRINQTAGRIYFSSRPHYMPAVEIEFGDNLQKIAAPYRISWQYLASLDEIKPRSIRPGQKLKVIKGPFSAYVDLSDFEMTIHAHGYFVRKYTVGVGKKSSGSPIGKFKVINKVENPEYTDPDGRRVAPDDPSNPLGEYWLDIGDSFGIHGTIDPESIGKAMSRGCIRMHNDEVVQVYHLLTIGSEVVIRR
ncbi:MAG: hypothetical protein CMJ78_24310 [Planctomycetaceae bacterium]|nr:hypothetical protein [Planctomycetaceae bacterium]